MMGLSQGNGAATDFWIMLSSLLIHCCHRQGRGSGIISPISGAITAFLGTLFFDNTDLVVYLPDLMTPLEVFNKIQESMLLWGSLLCNTGGALKA